MRAMRKPLDEEFLTPKEFQKFVRVSIRTVYKLIQQGKIPTIRMGRQFLIPRVFVEKIMQGEQT